MAIKLAGRSTGSTKPATRSTRKSTSKPSARRSKAPTRRSRTATAKPTEGAGSRPRRPVTDDPKVIKQYQKSLAKLGADYQAVKEEHKAMVNDVYEAAQEAMDAGIPTGMITEHLGLSRQWLYKMGNHAGRNGNGSGASKPKASTRKSSNGRRKTSTTKDTAKKSRPRIRTR